MSSIKRLQQKHSIVTMPLKWLFRSGLMGEVGLMYANLPIYKQG